MNKKQHSTALGEFLKQMLTNTPVGVLAPHHDDVFFSCWNYKMCGSYEENPKNLEEFFEYVSKYRFQIPNLYFESSHIFPSSMIENPSNHRLNNKLGIRACKTCHKIFDYYHNAGKQGGSRIVEYNDSFIKQFKMSFISSGIEIYDYYRGLNRL